MYMYMRQFVLGRGEARGRKRETEARTRQQTFCLEEPRGEAIAPRTTSLALVHKGLSLISTIVFPCTQLWMGYAGAEGRRNTGSCHVRAEISEMVDVSGTEARNGQGIIACCAFCA